MMRCSARPAGGCDTGSVPMLFLAFLLPILLFLSSLVLDLAAFRHETESAQRVADDAGMFAHRFLPYRSEAVRAATGYLGRFPRDAEGSTVEVVSDGIQVQISRNFHPIFGSFLLGDSSAIPLRVVSRVRSAPIDAFVVLDASDSIAPPLESDAGWGSEVEWPTSNYMERKIRALGLPLNSRVLTQRCFNPEFVAIKTAAIRAIDHLLGFTLNAVGAGVYSGGSSIEMLRPVKPPSVFPAFGAPDATLAQGESPWVNSIDCAAMAEAFDAPDRYRLPDPVPGLPVRGTLRGRPLAMIDDGQIASEYLPYLQVREALWAQVARSPRTGSSSRLVEEVFSALIHAAPMVERKGLIDSPLRAGIIIAGDLPIDGGERFPATPTANALRSAIRSSFLEFARTSKDAARSELLWVILRPVDSPSIFEAVRSLQDLLDEEVAAAGVPEDRFQAKVLYVSSSEDAVRALSQILTLASRISVLSL